MSTDKKQIEEGVLFKSNPEYFAKEKDGRKPNTIRRIPREDIRYELLATRRATKICIENNRTEEQFFRTITDISLWEGLWIISWQHEEEE